MILACELFHTLETSAVQHTTMSLNAAYMRFAMQEKNSQNLNYVTHTHTHGSAVSLCFVSSSSGREAISDGWLA